MNSRVTDCVSHPNGVSALVLTQSGIKTVRGKLFVCADGINSRIRTEIFDQPEANHTGFEAWRAMVPVDNLPSEFPIEYTHLILGRGKHAVLYPVKGGRYFNIVLITRASKKSNEIRKNESAKSLKKQTFFWNKKFKKLLDAASGWSVWPILECANAKNWHQDEMVMIGDAAHGMEPYAAQGAAMAIEDAYVLAETIKENNDLSVAFKKFQKSRMNRIRKVAKLARANRQLYHMGFPFSTIRNIGMAFIPGKKLLERQAWIYDWRAKE